MLGAHSQKHIETMIFETCELLSCVRDNDYDLKCFTKFITEEICLINGRLKEPHLAEVIHAQDVHERTYISIHMPFRNPHILYYWNVITSTNYVLLEVFYELCTIGK